jgi:hypothetical protein
MEYKGKIYKIIDNTNGNIYIGSTRHKLLNNRLAEHRNKYNNFLNGIGTSNTCFKIIENGNYNIELIEDCICKDIYELRDKERHYIDNNICVNKQKPNRTPQQYYEDNKETINKKRNEKKLCECGKYYTYQNYKRHLKTHNISI